MKKLLSILCAAALTLSLAACGTSTENYAGQTLTGQVTAIDGSAVTLQLGELTEDTNTPPDLPSSSSDAQTPPDGGSDANTPPEKPDDASGSDTQSPPDGGSAPSGQAPDSGSGTNTPPEKPEDSSDSGTANGQPPAKPDDASGDANGTPPDMPSGDAPSGGPGGSGFTAGDETVTLDFSGDAVRFSLKDGCCRNANGTVYDCGETARPFLTALTQQLREQTYSDAENIYQ